MFVRTARLTLRPGWPEDTEILTSALAELSAAGGVAQRRWPYAPCDAAFWLERANPAEGVALVIIAREEQVLTLVGGIGIAPIGDAHEFGFWVTPAARNCGFATEAGHAMIAIAQHALGVRRLRAVADPRDRAAERVLAKLAFRAQEPDERGATFERDLLEVALPIAA